MSLENIARARGKDFPKDKALPFLLTFAVIGLDQLTKAMVIRNLPYGKPVELFGDFLRLTFVQNPVIAWSIGRNLPFWAQQVLSLALPLMVLGVLLAYQFFSREIRPTQRWILAAILGGGAGNYLDRLFRVGGVVDFIDVKFYGLFGLDRWPTFNLADSTVLVGGLWLLASAFIGGKQKGETAP